MPTPAFGAAGAIAAAAGVGTTQVDVPYPAGITANDILILWALSRDVGDLAAPADWTAGAARNQTDLRGEWWWKRAAGGESGTVAVTRATALALFAGVMARFSGAVRTGTPHEAAAQTGLDASATWTPADITTLGGERLLIALACANDDLLSAADYTGGTATVTERVDVETGIGEELAPGGTLHLADAVLVAAGLFDFGAQTVVLTNNHTLFSFALIPAAETVFQVPATYPPTRFGPF